MATLPLNLALALALGASVALVGRASAATHPLHRSVGLWALVALQLLVCVPLGTYLMWRFPDWSLMYLAQPVELFVPRIYLALLPSVLALAAFVVGRQALARGSILTGVGILLAGLGLAAAIGFFGRQQLFLVGTTTEFRDEAVRMRPLWGTTLGYVLVAVIPTTFLAWLTTLWRVALVKELPRAAVEAEPLELGDESAPRKRPAKGTKKRAPKKKAS